MATANIFIAFPAYQRLIVLFLLFVVLATAGLVSLISFTENMALVFFSLLTLMITLALPLIIYRKTWGLFHPLVFTVLWYGVFHEIIRRVPVYVFGLDYHYALPGASADELNTIVAISLLLTTLGFVALYLGYIVSPKIPVPKLEFSQPKHLIPKILLIAIISTLGLGVLIKTAGGLGELLLQRGLTRSMRATADLGGHWIIATGLLNTACIVWIAFKPDDWHRPIFLSFFILSLFLVFVATGSRSGVILPFVFVVIAWSLNKRRIPYFKGLAAVLFGLIALGALGDFRAQSRGAEGLHDIEIKASFFDNLAQGVEVLTGYAGPSEGLYGIVGRVPNEIPLLYGESYLSILTTPIPRMLWPEKPISGGRLTGWYIFDKGPDGGGVPPGTIGEAYWNFHVFGVLFIMFFFGIFLKWLYYLYLENNGSGWIIAIYIPTLFNMQFNSATFFDWLQTMIPALILLFFLSGIPYRNKETITSN